MTLLDRRPLIVALAGPNGAGKTTFYHSHLQPTGLRLVNADVIAREMGLRDDATMLVTTARAVFSASRRASWRARRPL